MAGLVVAIALLDWATALVATTLRMPFFLDSHEDKGMMAKMPFECANRSS